MIDLAGSTVQAWECDVMGHLNIQLYIERALDGVAMLAVKLGIGPRALAARGLALEPVDQHLRLLRELRDGMIYVVRGGIVEATSSRVHFYCELVHGQTGAVAAGIRTECRLKYLDTQGDAEFSADLAHEAKPLTIEMPPHGLPRGLKLQPPCEALTLAEAEALGMIATFAGFTRPQECDQYGYLQPRFVTGCIIYGISHLLQPRNVGVEAEKFGGAAVENRIVYRRYPRAGDVLNMRSAISDIGEKTYAWVHWLFDAESGAMLATSKSVAIPMDLTTRKAIAIPDEFRERLESRFVEGLDV